MQNLCNMYTLFIYTFYKKRTEGLPTCIVIVIVKSSRILKNLEDFTSTITSTITIQGGCVKALRNKDIPRARFNVEFHILY